VTARIGSRRPGSKYLVVEHFTPDIRKLVGNDAHNEIGSFTLYLFTYVHTFVVYWMTLGSSNYVASVSYLLIVFFETCDNAIYYLTHY
jgi:hypothetical protein